MNSNTNNNNNNNAEIPADESATQHTLLREIEFSFDQLKQKVMRKFDALKEISLKQAIDGTKKTLKRSESITSASSALKDFEKTVSRQMESLKFGLLSDKRSFSPAVVDTIEVPSNIGFNYGANVYNQKHNMIITCPSNSYAYFYDASTLNAVKNRKRQQLDSSVVQMSYDVETDTHLMGCAFGDVYAYDAGKNLLKKIFREGESFILAISHLGNGNFAFSSSKTGQLFFANMDSTKGVPHFSYNSDAWYLHNIREKNMLLSGLSNGKIAIYNTSKPNFPMISSVQAHRFGKYVTAITNVTIKGKDYIITGGNDKTIKIWHTVKGTMRLLKVIQNEEDVSTIVYLEEYQMIATTHHRDFIKFFRIPTGTLEAKVELGLNKARNIFLMNDKNSLGVADLTRNYIKVVQLHASENSKKAI